MEYMPDDGGLTLDVLAYLEHHPGLLRAAGEVLRPTPADIDRLRRDHPPEAVRGALVVSEARRKAASKFAGFPNFHAEEFWGTPEAVEQASGADIALHKAAKVGDYLRSLNSPDPIWDFCSGIGGDALALAGLHNVVAVDLSAVRIWCLACNARGSNRISAVCGRVTPGLEIMHNAPGCLFHIDPARRHAGRRLHLYDDLIPGPEVIAALMRRFPAGLIKLSPAVDFASLPPGHLEVISSSGTVVQAVLWIGALAAPLRSATIIARDGKKTVVSGEPLAAPAEPVAPEAYLYEVDGAVHRAQLAPALMDQLGVKPVSADGGYVTSDATIIHGGLTPFRHHVTLGFDEKKLVDTLQSIHGEGPIEVKTRGGLGLDTDSLQKRLTAAAPTGASVLIYRGQRGVAASICQRGV